MNKVILIKSMRDDYDWDISQSDEQINPLSFAITKMFLRKDGELFLSLLSKFHLVPNVRLVLHTETNKNNEVVSLRLLLERKDLWMDHDFANKEAMQQAVADYFKRVGLTTIYPSSPQEIVTFVRWMAERVPTINYYLKVV